MVHDVKTDHPAHLLPQSTATKKHSYTKQHPEGSFKLVLVSPHLTVTASDMVLNVPPFNLDLGFRCDN